MIPVCVYLSKQKLTILCSKRYLEIFFNLQKYQNQISNLKSGHAPLTPYILWHCSLCLKGSYQGYCNFDISEMIIIPNRTFLVRFGSISGEFGRAMVSILARRSRAKIPMTRPNEPDMLPKRTKKGAIRYLP